jgi:BioD-like phosphotransacetylase family protein
MEGMFMGVAGLTLVKALKLPALLIDPYQTEVCVDCILAARETLGDRLLGVVLNRVTPASVAEVTGSVVPFLTRRGIPVLGTIPYDLLLDAITVRQLQGVLGGRVLCAEDRLGEFVERFSVGAMDVDSALSYFWRKPNKAVITGGHRSDILLAALETSTRCLILTGDQSPNDLIVARAVERGIPILVVPDDTLTTVEKVEAVLGRIRIREERKVARARQLIDAHLDYEMLNQRWAAFRQRHEG